MDVLTFGRVLVAVTLIAAVMGGLKWLEGSFGAWLSEDIAEYPVCPICEHCGPSAEFAENRDGVMVCKGGCS